MSDLLTLKASSSVTGMKSNIVYAEKSVLFRPLQINLQFLVLV